MAVSAVIVVHHHGKKELYYRHEDGHVHETGLKLCNLFTWNSSYDGSEAMWEDEIAPELSVLCQKCDDFPEIDEDVGYVYVLDVTDIGILLFVYKRSDSDDFYSSWEEWKKEKIFETEVIVRYTHEVRLLRIEY